MWSPSVLCTMLRSAMSPYPPFEHLPYAHEPWKSIYVFQRLVTTLSLVPVWVLYYVVMPRSIRPRESWSIKQIVAVRFTRRVYKVTEMAGITWGTRSPDYEPRQRCLNETRFEWIEPLPGELRTGILDDDEVPVVRTGVYVWPKQPLSIGLHHKSSTGKKGLKKLWGKRRATEATTRTSLPSSNNEADVEATTSAQVPLIGMFMHGGGYCHMSADEKSSTSRIPRRLMKVSSGCRSTTDRRFSR
jgi:hypothetical protein